MGILKGSGSSKSGAGKSGSGKAGSNQSGGSGRITGVAKSGSSARGGSTSRSASSKSNSTGIIKGVASSSKSNGITRTSQSFAQVGSGGNAKLSRGTVTGAASSDNIPRYDAPGFKPISTPNSTGLIKAYNGGKLGADGILRYPKGVNVDPDRHEKTQAYFDWNYGTKGASNLDAPRANMGSAYYDEFTRLQRLPVGSSFTGSGGDSGKRYLKYNPTKRPVNDGLYKEWEVTLWPGVPSTGSNGSGSGSSSGGNSAGNPEDVQAAYEAALKKAQEEQAKAYREAVEGALRRIGSQKDTLKQQYDDSSRQAYITSMQSRKNLPQMMAAQGLNGGATESAAVALETAYGNHTGDLSKAYQTDLAALERQAAQAQSDGDMHIAENAAAYQNLIAQAAQQSQQQKLDYERQKELLAYQQQLEYEYQAKLTALRARYGL